MVSSGHVIAVSFLDVLGLCLNVWFLFTVKARQSPYNAIDVLQALKTCLVVLALLCTVWLDLVTCSEARSDTTVLVCIGSKAFVENLLFHSVCFTLLSVACIRRKVCQCRGRADVLVTTRYACKTMFLAFTPVWMFIAATISLVSNYSNRKHSFQFSANATSPTSAVGESSVPNTVLDLMLSDYSKIIYQLFHTVILNWIPLVASLVIYIDIVQIVKRTADKTDGYVSQRTRNPTKVITVSVMILLTSTCTLWSIYTITALVASFVEITPSIFTFLKLSILITHPLGEGLLQPSTRKQGDRAVRLQTERSRWQICPESSPSMSSMRDEEGIRGLAEYLPRLIEERESTRYSAESYQRDNNKSNVPNALPPKKRRESIFHPRPSVLLKNAPLIGLEYRNEPTIVSLTKKRRESEERLKQGLKLIEEDQESMTSYRRLSRCLRLSSTEDFPDEEIYEGHRRRFSKDFRKQAKDRKKSLSSNLEEYKGLTYANTRILEDVAASPTRSVQSPSQLRWWRLLTTAKTARHFARKHRSKASGSNGELPMNVMNLESSINQDSDSNSSPVPNREHIKMKGYKKRSVSTTKNAWHLKNNERATARQRNKSVSFISNIVLDDDTPSRSNYPRSFSCDAKISVNYDEGDTDMRPGRRSKDGKQENNKMGSIRQDATKQECIQKLIQLKKYF